MTEQEWLMHDDPQRMLAWLTSKGIKRVPPQTTSTGRLCSDRKLRLFACACYWLACNCASDSAVAGNPRETIQIVEDWADHGKEPPLQGMPFRRRTDPDGDWELIPAPELAEGANSWARSWRFDEACKADILRDIAGNPYRPVTLQSEWLTPTVLTLAKAAYEERETEECGQCSGCGWVNTYGPSRVTVHCGKPTQERHDTDYGMMDGYRQRWCSVCWAGFLPEHTGSSTCPNCKGTGRITTGRLDPVRLAVLADALEEAGCSDEVEYVEAPAVMCCPKCGETGDHVRGNQAAYLMRCNSTECRFEWVLGETYRVKVVIGPNPILAHLRSPGQHYRGCWVLDLLLGKE